MNIRDSVEFFSAAILPTNENMCSYEDCLIKPETKFIKNLPYNIMTPNSSQSTFTVKCRARVHLGLPLFMYLWESIFWDVLQNHLCSPNQLLFQLNSEGKFFVEKLVCQYFKSENWCKKLVLVKKFPVGKLSLKI